MPRGYPAEFRRKVLDLVKTGYFAWRGRPPSVRPLRHAWLIEKIRQIHAVSRGIYGARRVHAELTLGSGLDSLAVGMAPVGPPEATYRPR